MFLNWVNIYKYDIFDNSVSFQEQIVVRKLIF
jgi:hypothetical protein